MPRRASLKVVSRSGTPTLYIRGTVGGVRVFESTGTSDAALAEQYRARVADRLYREALHGPAPQRAPDRTFAEAVISYIEAEPRSPNTKAAIKKLFLRLGETPLQAINQTSADEAAQVILRPGATGATKLRQIVTPLRAILRHAVTRGMLAAAPTIASPKVAKVRREFLRPAEALALVHASAPWLRPLIVFAIATGARPAEYLDLEWRDVDLRGKRARLLLKGGATRNVDLCQAALMALRATPDRAGHVFRPPRGDRYRDTGRSSGGQFSVAWAGACRRAGLPGEVRIYARKDRARGPSYERFAPDHPPYVMRHTWASWHYAIHKDLVLLEQDGAWEGPAMVRVYAHLMPAAYRQEALDFLEAKVDFHFETPNPKRAIAVQPAQAETSKGRKKP
jgi:integrase